MKHLRIFLIASLSICALAITGCASTSKSSLAKLEQTMPQISIISVNYVEAYANAKAYYQQCVARVGVSYPVTVYSNGKPVTITNKTPNTTISSSLDRQNKSALLSVALGSDISQRVLFSAVSQDSTKITFFSSKVGLLRSDTSKQKVQYEELVLLTQVSTNRTVKCIN